MSNWLSALLLLGILLGCHYLAFGRRVARWPLGRALQRALKLPMLALSLLAPLALNHWLEGTRPLLQLLLNHTLIFLALSGAIDGLWLLRTKAARRADWRPWLRGAALLLLLLGAGWQEPESSEVTTALICTGLLAGALLWAHHQIFRPRPHWGPYLKRLLRRLSRLSYLGIFALCGYYLLQAWTIVPITSGQLHLWEQGLFSLAALAGVEALASSLDHALRFRRRSQEVSRLAADALRACLYAALALSQLAPGQTHDWGQLLLSSAFFSLALGFALKPTLGNFVSGLLQRASQHFRLGDFVHIGSVYGRVTHIDWRSVSVATLTRDTVTIPHSQVAKSLLINYTWPNPQHGVYLEVNLPHHLPPGQVKIRLLNMLEQIPEVSLQPAPEVYLMDLKGSANRYRVLYWIDHIDHRVRYESQVIRQLTYQLERADMRPSHPLIHLIAEGEASIA